MKIGGCRFRKALRQQKMRRSDRQIWRALPAGYRLPSGRIARSAIASQLRRNAERLQPSAAHTSSALAFFPRIANSLVAGSTRRTATSPRNAGRHCRDLKGWLPSTLGASFRFGVLAWRIAAVAACQAPGKAPLCGQGPLITALACSSARYGPRRCHRGLARTCAIVRMSHQASCPRRDRVPDAPVSLQRSHS